MKIAVIVPVYNSERFLVRCTDSLAAQSFKDFIAYLVNDGSTDGSARILEELKTKHPFIRTLEQGNFGVSATRNLALDQALADVSITHVMFLDADDTFAPDCLAEVVKAAEADPAAVIEFDYDSVDEYGGLIRHCRSDGNSACLRCFPRAAVEDVRFFTGATVAEDIAFNLEIAHRHHPAVIHLEKPLYNYYMNSSSAMHRELAAEDFRKRVALIEYLVSVYSNSPSDLCEFARTDLPDLLKQFHRHLKSTAAIDRDRARGELTQLCGYLRRRGLLKPRKGRIKDFKYFLRFWFESLSPVPREYDLIFSVGRACSCSEALRNAGLQLLSFPFDWIGEPGIATQTRFLMNDFEGWLPSPDRMTKISEEDFKFVFWRDDAYGYMFFHDFGHQLPLAEELPVVRAKYLRRYQRLCKIAESSRRILIVSVEMPERKNFDTHEAILAARSELRRKWANAQLDVLVFRWKKDVPFADRRDWLEDGVRYIEFDYQDQVEKRYYADFRMLGGLLRKEYSVVDYRTESEKAKAKKAKKW